MSPNADENVVAGRTPEALRVSAVTTPGSSGGGGVIRMSLASHCFITRSRYRSTFSFRADSRVSGYLKDYLFVELVSVEFAVTQLKVRNADSEGVDPRIIKFGLVPRGLSVSSYTEAANTPHLTVLSESFGTGAFVRGRIEAFPPGLQTDLAAAEIRGKYPEFGIFNLSIPDLINADDSKKVVGNASENIWRVDLNFVVSCHTPAFGNNSA